MAKNSKIEWTDHTLNLWWGCTEVHAGCDNCYAREWSNRFNSELWGDDAPRKIVKSAFGNLAKWQASAQSEGVKKKVFVGSMMDIFEKPRPLVNNEGGLVIVGERPTRHAASTNNLRSQLFENISLDYYPNLIFLFLTKRPSNINKMIPSEWLYNPPCNVWFGASVVDQRTAYDVARHLKKVNGNTFWSVEPLLEEIDVWVTALKSEEYSPDWIIVGGESGPNRRPFEPNWARVIRKDCEQLEIPFFMKQWDKVKQVPDDLMIREFPKF